MPLPIEALDSVGRRPRAAAVPSQVRLPKVLGECLTHEAARRRTTPGALALRLLRAVLADGLVDAVLDDRRAGR